MPKITSAQTIPALGPAIKHNMHGFPFMVIARNADNVFMLYGGNTSCEASMQEALSDHPLAELVQEVEYLTKERAEALPGGIQNLGQVDPDPKRLRAH